MFNLASSIRLESKILLLCESNPSLIGSNSSFTHIYILYSINNFLWCAFKKLYTSFFLFTNWKTFVFENCERKNLLIFVMFNKNKKFYEQPQKLFKTKEKKPVNKEINIKYIESCKVIYRLLRKYLLLLMLNIK